MLTLPWKKTASVGSLLGLYILSVIIFFPWRFVCIEEYLAAWCLHVHFGKYTALLWWVEMSLDIAKYVLG